MTDTKADSKKNAAAEILSLEPFPIQVLCNFISPYKGDRETLTAFLTNCQNALDLALPNQRVLLFKYIIAKLEGKAQIACSNKVFDNFEALKTFLNQNFGERKHYNHLLLDLQSCKQQSNETVAEFALRIERCLTELQAEIHNSDTLKKDLSGRIAMTEDLALFTFNLGLHPRLSNNVRCRSPKSLNDAINIAQEEEKIQNLLYKTSNNKPKCKICGKPGHSDSDCRTAKRVAQPRAAYQADQSPSSHQNPGSTFCRYCKIKGHDISQCRKRQFNENKNHNNSKPVHVSYDEPPPSSVPSPTPDQVSCEYDGESDCDLN
ncbi:hypothetical protein ABMA28_015320 [Loxostege sticticalis]|uniref:CCHC-type domain-containing protein n=1 Tax=Loxostege sticticalis TaxID=481309 RepID=A0ABD0T9E5_LOXSC